VRDKVRGIPIVGTASTDRARRWRLILFALGCIALGYLFFSFGSEVAERETRTFDRAVRTWALAHQGSAARGFFAAITWLGSSYVLGPAALLLGAVLVRRGARYRPLLLAVTPLVFWTFVTLLKRGYHVTRPLTGLLTRHSFSFPSGHAAMSMAAAVFLGYVLVRERMAPRWILVAAPLVSLVVGFSRVYLDVHWASDVLGGWAIGAAYGSACCALYALTQWHAGTAHLTAEGRHAQPADANG
jgi:undecaprenyl-diphosphatase